MVKVQIGEHNMYVDGYLKSNLDAVKHDVLRKRFDAFIVVSGREGYGKSTLASQVALYLDPTYNLDRCTFTSEQFKEACSFATRGQAVVFDETMGYLSSRGAMSKFNRDLIKIMSEMRSKNLFVILCIPNFFELDKYPAIHRSTGLLHVTKRGHIGAYNYKNKKILYLKGKKFYSYTTPPDFVCRFTKYFPLDEEEYEKKKQGAINSWIETKGYDNVLKKRNFQLMKALHDRGATHEQIGEIIGIKRTNVTKLLGNGGLSQS